MQRLTEIFQNRDITNTNQVLNSKNQISILVKEFGINEVRSILSELIYDLCDYLNVQRNMNSKQIAQTTDLLIIEYPHYKAEDFILAFKNIKTQRYGKIYESFDGGKLFEFIKFYDDERFDEIESLRLKEKAEDKNNLIDAFQSEQGLRLLKSAMAMTINKEKIEVKQSENNKMFQDWMREFDLIYKENPIDDLMKPRFINYNGKAVNCEEYLEIKLKEHEDNS